MEFSKTESKWWKAALAGLNPPIVAATPMRGFYAFKAARDALPEPVAIYYSEDGRDLRVLIGKVMAKEPHKTWEWCARHPIPYETYKEVLAGAPWPHEIRVTLEDGEEQSTLTGVGHNSGDDEQAIFGNIEEWISQGEKALRKGPPKTQQDADAMSDLATKLSDLAKEAEARRKELTAPLIDQQREMKARFDAKTKPATATVAKLKTAIGIWFKEEEKRRAEQAAAAQEVAGEGVKIEAARASAGTRRSVSTVKRTLAVIDDIGALAAYLVGMEKVPEDVREACQASALRLLRAGVTVPGAHLETVEGVR